MAVVALRLYTKPVRRAILPGVLLWSMASALALTMGISSDGWWSVPLFLGSAAAAFVVWRRYRWPDQWSLPELRCVSLVEPRTLLGCFLSLRRAVLGVAVFQCGAGVLRWRVFNKENLLRPWRLLPRLRSLCEGVPTSARRRGGRRGEITSSSRRG